MSSKTSTRREKEMVPRARPKWTILEMYRAALIGSNRAPSGFTAGDTRGEGAARLSVGIYHRLNCKRRYPVSIGATICAVAPRMDFRVNGARQGGPNACKSSAKSPSLMHREFSCGSPVFFCEFDAIPIRRPVRPICPDAICGICFWEISTDLADVHTYSWN